MNADNPDEHYDAAQYCKSDADGNADSQVIVYTGHESIHDESPKDKNGRKDGYERDDSQFTRLHGSTENP